MLKNTVDVIDNTADVLNKFANAHSDCNSIGKLYYIIRLFDSILIFSEAD